LMSLSGACCGIKRTGRHSILRFVGKLSEHFVGGLKRLTGPV
jgi:hypothetical protein